MEFNQDNKSRSMSNSNLNTELDIILLLKIFRKNILLFLLIIVSCVVVSFIYLRYTVPVYQSQLTLQVGSENTAQRVLKSDNFGQDDDVAKDVELLKSKLLFKRALQQLPFKVSYFNKGKFLTYELYKTSPIKVEYQLQDSSIIGKSFLLEFVSTTEFNLFQNDNIIGKYTNNERIELPEGVITIKIIDAQKVNDYVDNVNGTSMFFTINNLDDLTNSYIKRLSVFPLNPSAKTINISFQDNNALKSTDIVTTLADEYILYDIEERSKSSKNVIQFLDAQLDKYYNKVKVSENKIQNFQTSNKGSIQEFSTIYLERLNRFENQLIDIEFQKSVLTEIYNSVPSNLSNIDVFNLMPTLSGTEYEASVTSLITNLQNLLVEKQNLLGEVTPSSEAVKNIERKIEVQKKVLFTTINSLIQRLESKRKEVEKRVNEIQSKYLKIPAEELEYARLQRVLSIDEKFFTLLMEKRTEYSISEAGFVPQHTILDQAVVPSAPISPNKKIIVITGFMLGLVISILILILRYIFKNTISSIDEINRFTQSSFGFLGNVPVYHKVIPVSQLVIDKEPKSVISEAFRSIRSNLQFVKSTNDKKLIAITSTISGEGKTFCAINLAGILAMSDKKVIILDLDMRKPKIHVGFGVDNTSGMSTLLINKNSLEECIHNSDLGGLDYITSGPIPPNPSELIINGELTKIIEELKTKYDYVIIDNPPIGLVSDAMETLKIADYPIYVFKSEYSRRNFANNVDRLIRDNGISKLSVILNSVNFKDRLYGYGNNYGYGYGYGRGGYGYYTDGDENETIKEKIIKKVKRKKS